MTGIYFDTVTNDWAIEVAAAGGVVGYAATASEAAAMLQNEVARWEHFHATQAQSLAAMLPPVALPAPDVSVATVSASAAPRERCAWHSAIRYFFGQAKGAGLSTRNDETMRQALAAFIGRAIGSRSELSAGEWLSAGDAVKFGRLVW